MEHIKFEAEHENANDKEELVFSDHEDENFIDYSNQEDNQLPSFYRFLNQRRDPIEAVNDDGSKLDKQDLQLEMFYCIKREHLESDEFDDSKKYAEKFKKACACFSELI